MRFLFFFPLFLFSAPIGNPCAPALLEEGFFISDESWSCPEAAYAGDFLLQKRFQSTNKTFSEMNLEGSSQMGQIAWCICERLLLQLELGSGSFDWHSGRSNVSLAGRAQDGLIWSGSGKIVVFEAKDTSLALDGHAGGWDWMNGSFSLNGIPQVGETQTKLRYWQAAVGVCQKTALFTPYAGVAVNQTRFKMSGLMSRGAVFNGWYTVGPFVGCSLTNGSRFFINLEWRGWFENGVSLSGQVRF